MSQQRQSKDLSSVTPLKSETNQTLSPPNQGTPPFQAPYTNVHLQYGLQTPELSQPPQTNHCHRCGKELGLIDRIGSNKQITPCRTCSNQINQSLQRFRTAFLDVTRSGKLSTNEWAALQAVTNQERLDQSEALAFIMKDAIDLIGRIVGQAETNGGVTNEIEKQVSQMLSALHIPPDIAFPLYSRVSQLRRQANMQKLDRAVAELETKGDATEDDEKHIYKLQATLAILPEEAQPFYQRLTSLKKRANIQRFQRAAELVEKNGGMTKEARQSLLQLQQTLAIPFETTAPIFQQLSLLKQQENIQRFQSVAELIENRGVVTDEDQNSLLQMQQTLSISNEIAQPIFQRLADLKRQANIQRFLHAVELAESKGEVTEETQFTILQLQQSLAIPNEIAYPAFQRLAYLKKLTRIRKGVLTAIKTDVHLESNEICHLETSGIYHKVNNRSTTYITGRLLATNKRLHFLSTTRGMTINWNNIMRVEVRNSIPNSRGVYLELSKGTGNGLYAVSDPTLVGAILETLVKIAKRQLVVTNAEPSRHIPQDVKNTVWQRDGGKCTQCGSTSYLEFDHIIPHAKGGANSVENVQLLCRSCNLKKSDHI